MIFFTYLINAKTHETIWQVDLIHQVQAGMASTLFTTTCAENCTSS
ncbi:hypothetical protein [Marinifilum breve]|nr:hypothetical protein [Marinifilum breve]